MKHVTLSAALITFACPAIADDGSEDAAADPYLANIAHLFETAQVVDGPSYVDCTLSDGAASTCFSITVIGAPTTSTPGPWCPTNLATGPEDSGKWFVEGDFVDADGAFMDRLAELYDDDTWQMVDPETGAISVTDTVESCAAAARPDVGEEYANFCVQCATEYLPEDLTLTYVIPTEPVLVDEIAPRVTAGSGVAFNGIRLDAAAPVDAILGAYTIAPFDDCGGHVNLVVGYHYHAATDCLTPSAHQGEDALQIGIAMDGHLILARRLTDGTTPTDLDQCNGHIGEDGYHYHAGEEGANEILGCHVAAVGCVLEDPDAVCDASVRRQRP